MGEGTQRGMRKGRSGPSKPCLAPGFTSPSRPLILTKPGTPLRTLAKAPCVPGGSRSDSGQAATWGAKQMEIWTREQSQPVDQGNPIGLSPGAPVARTGLVTENNKGRFHGPAWPMGKAGPAPSPRGPTGSAGPSPSPRVDLGKEPLPGLRRDGIWEEHLDKQ